MVKWCEHMWNAVFGCLLNVLCASFFLGVMLTRTKGESQAQLSRFCRLCSAFFEPPLELSGFSEWWQRHHHDQPMNPGPLPAHPWEALGASSASTPSGPKREQWKGLKRLKFKALPSLEQAQIVQIIANDGKATPRPSSLKCQSPCHEQIPFCAREHDMSLTKGALESIWANMVTQGI